MVRAELVVVPAALLTLLVLGLAGARWAWIARSTVICARTTSPTTEERAKSGISTTWNPVMETSTTQIFMTEVYPMISNRTEISSTSRFAGITATERSTTEYPTTRPSFKKASGMIIPQIPLTNFADKLNVSLSPEIPNPEIHTFRPQIGLENATEFHAQNTNKTHWPTHDNYLHLAYSSNHDMNSSELVGRFENASTIPGRREKLTLNESGGFTNSSLHPPPEAYARTVSPSKSTVLEALEKVYHTTVPNALFSENVTVSTSFKPSVVGLNISGDAPDVDYVKMGQELVVEAIAVLDSGVWDFERRTEDGDIIFSRTLDNGNTVYRLTGIVDMPAQDLLVIIYDGLADYPKWNPTLLECRVLEKINDQTDISYTVSAPGARGYVASRDFVSLRHWDVNQNSYVAATKSIDFLNAPSNPDYIRGQNGAGCMELRPLSSDSFKTEFRWLLNTRLNGWIPSYIADKAYKKFMTKYMVFLREYCKKVKQRAAEALTPTAGNNTTPSV